MLTYKFKCEAVVCEIAAFTRESDELGSVCTLNDQCSNRYNNLFPSYRAMKTDQTYERGKIVSKEFELKLNGVPGDAPIHNSSSKSTPACFFTFLVLYFAL